MVIFAIPLRAQETSKDWNACVARLNQTLRSIFNQTDPDFRCILACNKKPNLDREYDERLEVIELDMPVPTEWIEMARDKFWKLTMIAVRVREILETLPNPENGVYVMPVDADDLLHRGISEYCKLHPNENGLVSKDGYVWRGKKKYFEIFQNMHTFCGSCNIIKMYREDLPGECPADPKLCHDKQTAGVLNKRYPIRYDHNEVVERYKKAGKPFALLPFRSTIYVLDTGDNISSIYHGLEGSDSDRVFHPVAFLRKINPLDKKHITKKIKCDYGML